MGKVRGGGGVAPTGGKAEGKTPTWDKIASQCIKFLRERHPQELSELSSKALKKPPGKIVQSKVEKVTEEWRLKEEFEERKKVDAIKVFLRWCELYRQAWLDGKINTDPYRSYKRKVEEIEGLDDDIYYNLSIGVYVPVFTRFEPAVTSKLRGLYHKDPELVELFIERMLNANSNVSSTKSLLQGPFLHTAFYSTTITVDVRAVWMVTVEKVDGQFRQVIFVLGLSTSDKASSGIVSRVLKTFDQDHNYLDPSSSYSSHDPSSSSSTSSSSSFSTVTLNRLPLVKVDKSKQGAVVFNPITFDAVKYKEPEGTKAPNPRSFTDQKVPESPARETIIGVGGERDYPSSIRGDEMVINSLSSQESCAQLVDLLEDLPTLNMTLSSEEKAVIRWGGNVLLIGRSGTGKTTCAALRLWARNKLFSFLMEHEEKTNLTTSSSSSSSSSPPSTSKAWNFNSVFLSLSPVLCNQVKKYYQKLDAKTQGGDEVVKKHLGVSEDGQVKGEVESTDNISESTSEAGADAGDDPEEEVGDDDTQVQYLNPLLRPNYNSSCFPMFTTLRGMLYMIDETLQEPFFVREAKGTKKNLGAAFSWSHDEHSQPVLIRKRYVETESSELKIKPASGIPIRAAANLLLGDSDSDDDEDLLADSDNEEEEEEEEDEAAVVARRRRNQRKRIIEKIETSFEIGYNYFSKVMIRHLGASSIYHPSLIWTEIMSYIKGSVESLESSTGYLDEKEYLAMGKKRSPLPAGNRKEIYRIFLNYEREKDRVKGYDLQDMVFHLYNRLRNEGYRGSVLHSITVDEVQDFTQATLRVLFSVCNQPQGMFFTGDTCQTIARGVGFRFCELQAIFYQKKQSNQMLKIEVPTVQQLLVNYRSHSNLLRLSNSVLDILETHFPNAIDRLHKDRGTRDGPVPVLLTTSSLDDLFVLLFGSRFSTKSIEFGANQVIVVRDQDSKKRLPSVLQGAMVLTVYESKGLEFEDVILFDFFADSPATWPMFNLTDISDGTPLPPEAKGVAETSLAQMDLRAHDERSESPLLCSELKHLYTAITRAKTRLFIFDRNVAKRQPMFDYWRRRGIISELGLSEKMELNANIIKKTSKGEWRTQGVLMLRNRYYGQAIKCFQYSGDEAYQKKAEALEIAVSAADILQQSSSMTDQNYQTETDRRSTKRQEELKAESKQLAAKAAELFKEAGEVFLSLQLPKYAARCFSSSGDHFKAAHLFATRRSSWVDAARCYFSAEKWDLAAEYFFKVNHIEDGIECLERGQLWSQLLEALANYKQSFTVEAFDALIRKYVPIMVDNLAFNKSGTSSQKDHSVEESWQTMLHIISIVAPELGLNLRKSRSQQGEGGRATLTSSVVVAADGYIDSTILSLLEEHGFYGLCLRLLIEHKKRIRDVELEFEQDFKLQEYVSILCFQEAKKRSKVTLRRSCNALFEVSQPGRSAFC